MMMMVLRMAVLGGRVVTYSHDLADLRLELLQLLLLYPDMLISVLQVALQNRIFLYIIV